MAILAVFLIFLGLLGPLTIIAAAKRAAAVEPDYESLDWERRHARD